MVETKSKTKLVKLLSSIVLGLAFLCLGFFAGFGGKIEEFVKGADEPTVSSPTDVYKTAMIYVDSGATTNITGGSVGAMSNGNSVYVADGGTLNVTGGTVSGNIYSDGTLNYTAGTLNSVTLASGKYITFKGNPSSTISITLYGGASVGETVGYLDGITSVTLSRLSVTNLPANTELRIEGGYIKIRYVNRTVTITASPSGYGSVSGSSITIPHGSSVSVSGSTLSYGGTTVTATPAAQTAQYTYSFAGWYVNNTTKITGSSYTVTGNTSITARFTRDTRTYTVTILEYNGSYGTVSPTTINVPYGTRIYRGSSITQLYVGETLVTATPNSSTSQYSYSVSSWREDSSSGTTITTTGFTLEGDKDIYVRFTKSTRGYWVYAYARYSTSSSGTNSGATAGITGGTASITYNSSTSTTSGTGRVGKRVDYGDTVSLSASAKTGYVFVGWYSSTRTTTASSTSSSYSLNITGTTYRYAFFRRASYTITIAVSPSGYGSVSRTSITADYGTSITTSGSTLSIGDTDITATPASQTAQYTYAFSSWSNASGTVTGARTITANFTKTTRTYTVTIAVSPSGYGSVSRTSITADYGTSITTSGSTLSIGDTDITATPASQTAQYTYAFSSWSNASGTVTGAKTITANFTRTTRTYTVTIAVSPSGYGSVSQTSVTNVPYGTVLSQNGNTLNVNGTIVTATPATASAQYTYAFSSWTIGAATETGYVPVTANFTRTTRTYSITVIPRYSTSTSGTNATATNGTTGGTVSTTSTSATNGYSMIIPGIRYNSSVSITASPASGYSFVGWYTSTSSTSATSTSSTYRPTVTSSRTYYAFFRKAGYTVTFTKTVSAPSTFAPSSLLVQEDPGISVYYIVMRALQFGPRATWGGDGLTSNQSSYTVSGSQDFYVNYTIPKTTTVEGTGTTIGYTESHSVKIVKNGTTVVNKSSTTTLQTGTYDFTTTGTTTIKIELKTWRSGAVITFDDNLSNENKDNPIYIDKRQYVILQKRILY